MSTPFKLLNPRNDVVFKLLFGREPDLLCSMLEAVLSQKIDTVTVVNPELPGDLSAEKNIVLDVRVSLGNGTRVDVEMQVRVTPELAARLVYYASRDYAQQLPRGQHFRNLTPTVLVVWLDQPLWAGKPGLHRVFELRERHSGELFCEQLAIHVLQLRDWSVPSPGHAPKLDTALQRWARFLATETAEQLQALAKEDLIMAQAAQSLERISQNPEAARLAREREDSVKLYHMELAASLQQGIAEGLQKGIAEGEQQGIAHSIRQVCQALGIAMTAEREVQLLAPSEKLRQLLDQLLHQRTWPD